MPTSSLHSHLPVFQQPRSSFELTAAPTTKQFKKLLAPGKISQALCLGNLTDKPTYEYLRSVSPDLKIVKGRFDVEATSLPLTQVVAHGSLRIGFLEGFTLVSNEPDLLLAEANKLDVDVLCWGGTHRFECFEYMDKFFVNPGSATGAFSTGWGTAEGEEGEVVPSFCLMDVCAAVVALVFLFHPWNLWYLPGFLTDPTVPKHATGPRHIPHALRLPATKRRKWRRERRGGESHIYQTGGAHGSIIMRTARCAAAEAIAWRSCGFLF